MKKIDFKKEMKDVFGASAKKSSDVVVPDMKYLSMAGKGHPENNPEFADVMEAIYRTAYTLKFMLKDEALQPEGYYDFVIPPMEGIYESDNMEFDLNKPETWSWVMMVMQPDWITDELVEKAKAEIRKKKDAPGLDRMKFEIIKGGKAKQILHIGPYGEVGAIYQALHDEIAADGNELAPACREIYISDQRRTAPEKRKTVVRQYYK